MKSTRPQSHIIGGGAMGDLIRSYDWSNTTLGSISDWQPSLCSSVNLVLHSSVPMVMLWGENGIMIYNDAYSKFAGARHPSLLGSKVVDGWPEVADFNKNVLKVGLAGRNLSYKDQELTLYRNGSAEQVWLDLNYSPLFDADSKPSGILAVVVETTQRVLAEKTQKETQANLEVQKEQFQMMADNIPNLAWMANADGWIYWYNLRWYEYTGTSAKDMEGWGWQSVHDSKTLPNVLRVWKKSIKNGEPFEMVFPLKRFDGIFQQFLTRVVPVKNDNGVITHWFGSNTDITEKLEAKKIQLSMSDQLIKILDSMGDAFFILDKKFNFVRVNKMHEKLSQTKRKDMIGKNLWELFPTTANKKSNYWIQYHKVISTGKAVRFTEFYKPLNMWTEVDAYPTEEGGISVFFRDVSARKNGEIERLRLVQELKAEKDRFRTLIEKSTDAIQLVDPKGKILYSSESIKNVLGYTAEELQNSGVAPYLHPDDAEYFYEKLTELIKNPKRPIHLQYRVKHKDGSWAWLETTGVNHLKTPNIKALVGTFRNITDKKNADAALHQQLQVTKALTETATACLFMIDENGLVTFMNQSAEIVTEFSQKDVLGKPMHSLVHHSYPDGTPYPESECPLVATYRYGKPNPLHEDIFFRKNGSPFSALITGTSIPGMYGTQGTVVEFRDITEEKRAQDELRELITITEQRNALIKINNTKDEFIGMASHQLRTPATAVKQYIGLLMDDFAGPLSTDQRKYLKIAYDSNERELSIINDLLKTALISTDKYRLQKQTYDVSKLLEECITDLQVSFDQKQQKTIFTKPDIDIKVLLDRTEIKLVLINLLENASKYSRPNTEIRVSLTRKEKYIEIAITDKGVGISQENQQRIFDKFTRVDNELSDTVTGTGLGLFWVKQIIELHKGSIRLKSGLGNGSIFTVRLPR